MFVTSLHAASPCFFFWGAFSLLFLLGGAVFLLLVLLGVAAFSLSLVVGLKLIRFFSKKKHLRRLKGGVRPSGFRV